MEQKPVNIFWTGSGPTPELVTQAVAGRWPLHDGLPDGPVMGAAVVLSFGTADDSVEGGVVSICADKAITVENLAVKLETATSLARSVRQMQVELSEAKANMKRAAQAATHLDEEMRLASRLQQDFLPRRLPTVGPAKFGVYYQPASFVSGDIYDVVRLDETHVGFYVADAVGHGLPAALLTMFIKEALQTKRISGHTYEIIPPHEALAQLNADLCRQQLTMCEFCTALYGVMDTATLTVSLCRAGHPAPLLLPADGSDAKELALPGPLLGILDDAQFESLDIQLTPGDRLMLFSDGAEDTLCGTGHNRTAEFPDLIGPLANQTRAEMLQTIGNMVEEKGVCDDVTILMAEV